MKLKRTPVRPLALNQVVSGWRINGAMDNGYTTEDMYKSGEPRETLPLLYGEMKPKPTGDHFNNNNEYHQLQKNMVKATGGLHSLPDVQNNTSQPRDSLLPDVLPLDIPIRTNGLDTPEDDEDATTPIAIIPDEVEAESEEADIESGEEEEEGEEDRKSDVTQSSFRDELSADLIDLLEMLEISKNSAKKRRLQEQNQREGEEDEEETVSDIETSLPNIDWEAMEAHLALAAKEDDEWLSKRRHDREEIRRKLAMDTEEEESIADDEEYFCGEKFRDRHASLATRLQSNMNLQICFLNETASDLDSLDGSLNSNGPLPPMAAVEPPPPTKPQEKPPIVEPAKNPPPAATKKPERPSFFFNRRRSWRLGRASKEMEDEEVSKQPAATPSEDFHARHARLQAEARLALAQAKDMARMQMDVEKHRRKKSPIAEIVGFPSAETHHLTKARMTAMNVAQLQVIVNDLHTQIESLNEELVGLLMERDDLHMEQDSMLVDIEDLNRYLGAKWESLKADLTSPTRA